MEGISEHTWANTQALAPDVTLPLDAVEEESLRAVRELLSVRRGGGHGWLKMKKATWEGEEKDFEKERDWSSGEEGHFELTVSDLRKQTSVRGPQASGFCRHPEWAWKGALSRGLETRAGPHNTLFLALQDSQLSSIEPTPTSNYRTDM